MSVTRQNAHVRFAELTAELAEVQKIIDSTEPDSLISVNGDDFYYLTTGDYVYGSFLPRLFTEKDNIRMRGAAIFENIEQAHSYAFAIEMMVSLRHMPGTIIPYKWEQDRTMYTIEPRFIDGEIVDIMIGSWLRRESTVSKISPAFATKEDALNAINVIGVKRLIRMYKTFHHLP